MISAPILSKLNHEKDPRYHASFVRALETLNRGITEKKIWNVELNDAKFTLSNAVDRALGIIYHRSSCTGDYVYEEWTNDFSGYISFNQAAGRIKRLTKNAPKTKVVQDYIEALKEVDAIWKVIQSLKPFIQKGRRPNQNKTEERIAVDFRNTGICAICGKRQKLDSDKLVHHGYQMSEYNHSGVRMGRCFGVDYLPYELSNEANLAYAPKLEHWRQGLEAALVQHKSGTIRNLVIEEHGWDTRNSKATTTEITVYKTGATAGKFARALESRIYKLESELRTVNRMVEANDAKIKGWTLQPLKYGR